MTLYSLQFLLFFTVVFIVYYLIPGKYRYIWLAIASVFFYSTQGMDFLWVLLGVAVVTYAAAIVIKEVKESKAIMGICVTFIAGLLFTTRLLPFFPEGGFFSNCMAVGVSFYSLVAMGYVVDVYYNRTEYEKNFVKYLLFLSFFPIVLSGPIERAGNLLSQIKKGTVFSYEGAKKGIHAIMYGLFLKCLIADRMAVIVDALFDSYAEQTGAAMLFGVIMYGLQLYADFSGYSHIAVGLSSLLGFRVTENFTRPYFSRNIKEFWGRWHISLSTWLRDYIYIPLGGNRKGRIRQNFNLLVTFVVSGFWHGSGLQFIVWGLIHGTYQVIYNLMSPYIGRIGEKTGIRKDCFSFRLLQSVSTFLIVDFAWLFFRASSLTQAISIIEIISRKFELGNTIENRLWLAGYDYERYVILLAEMIVWFGVEIAHENSKSVGGWLLEQNKAFRWLFYMVAGIALIVGMLYNYGLDAGTFIYSRF